MDERELWKRGQGRGLCEMKTANPDLCRLGQRSINFALKRTENPRTMYKDKVGVL
jgi:hypothetical protein